MRISALFALLLYGASGLGDLVAEDLALTPAEEEFRSEMETKAAALEKKNASVFAGKDGWLFLASELRFLGQGRFWGEAAAKTGRSQKPGTADPIPAIVDFHRQLRERGIDLLLVPVPAKAAVYPEKVSPNVRLTGAESAGELARFYSELRQRGIDVLDLTSLFAHHRADSRGPVFCRTDSHWSGVGCVLAAQAIGEYVRGKFQTSLPRKDYLSEWKDASVTGDLVTLLPADIPKSASEKIAVRTVVEKAGGQPVQPDANSPVLLMGDSHTLVYHDFLAEKSGLVDQLAEELGFAPDLIGTRGSGATAVRISLYRKARSDPNYLAKKKVIVWCFAAREFTEADQGWVPQPITK